MNGVFGPFSRSTQIKGTPDMRGSTYLGLRSHFSVLMLYQLNPNTKWREFPLYRGVLGSPLVFDNAYGQ